jgi:3-oxoacyl-[acyl-carrier-protein] synthase-3
MRTALLGLGHHLPPVVDAAGVRRPIAASGGSSDLALPASHAALASAGVGADEVDFIIFATMSPDVTFPGSACFFQHKMGCATVGALDIRAQCAGFLFGLSIADQFIRAGRYRRLLLIGGEVLSSALDYSEGGARIAALFGDGAGAVLLGPTDRDAGVMSVAIHSDGRQYDRFWCEYPSSRQHPVRMTVENFRARRHFPVLDFDAVRKGGLDTLPAVIDEALHRAQLGPQAVDRFVISHVFPDVSESVAGRLGVLPRLVNPSRDDGHLAAAAIPSTLCRLVERGEVGPGAIVCLAASGSGFAWGAAVVKL